MTDFKLTEGETLVAQSKADRTTSIGGVQSGMMYLTSKRLVFCCTPGISRTLVGSVTSKLRADNETTIFAEVSREKIQLKEWLFWKRLVIDDQDTQIIIPKKLLKYLEEVKILDKSEASKVKGGGPNLKTFLIRLSFIAVGVAIISIPLVKYINEENEKLGITTSSRINSLEKSQSESSLFYFNSATEKYNAGDNYGAIADYTKAIEINPRYANAYINRGNAKNNLEDYYGAIFDYTKAIEINPRDANAYGNRGIVKDNLEDYYGAIADYTKAIEINPRYANAYVNRGIVNENLGDLQGACVDWRQASYLGYEDAAKWVSNQCQ